MRDTWPLPWRRQSEFPASLRTTLRKELMSVVSLGSVVAGAELAIDEVVRRKDVVYFIFVLKQGRFILFLY